ncbi:MAG: hypothetical protein IJZ27_07535, partial [Treponema sp.]|nr:hypothetical protein [Treponema sp.]
EDNYLSLVKVPLNLTAKEIRIEWKETHGSSKVHLFAADFINDAGIYDSSDIENANYTKGGTAPVSASAKHTLQRLNTSDILQKIQNDEKVELPVKVDSESWQIVKGGFSAGVVE